MDKDQELIKHFKNLFGYTKTAVAEAIKEINEGDEHPDIKKILMQRAGELSESLEFIKKHM